jgi:hypothetical protein
MMGKTHSMNTEELNAYLVLKGKPDGIGHWKDLNVGGRVV